MNSDPVVQLPFFVIAWRLANAPAQLVQDRGKLYLTVGWRAPLGAVNYARLQRREPITQPTTASPTD
jgi:hypothetical protein